MNETVSNVPPTASSTPGGRTATGRGLVTRPSAARSGSHARAVMTVFLVAIVIQCAAYDTTINTYDEGIILVGAERALDGEVPYRDFWTMYGPASFYLTAALYKLFGVSDLAVRAVGILAKTAIAGLSFHLAGRFVSRSLAMATALVVLGILIFVRQDAFPLFPALALSMGALVLAERGASGRRSRLFVAGMLTGLATAFRHDIGAYGAAANALGIAIAVLLARPATPPRSAVAIAGSRIALYVAGIVTVFAPIAAMLLSTVPLADLHQNLIHIPSVIYPKVRSLAFPFIGNVFDPTQRRYPLTEYAVYVPFIAVIWAVAIERRRAGTAARRSNATPEAAEDGGILLALLTLTCGLFIIKGLVRVSTLHMVQSLTLSAIILAAGAARIDWASMTNRRRFGPPLMVATLLLSLVAVSGGIAVGKGVAGLFSGRSRLLSLCVEPVLPRIRCATSDDASLAAARFVRAQSSPEDRIYVGAGRHDKILVNPVALYFLAERRPATKWYELHPGVQTEAAIQREMIGELQASMPRFVLLDDRWDTVAEPNDSSRSSGVTLLDDFIRDTFVETARFGSVHILVPRPADG